MKSRIIVPGICFLVALSSLDSSQTFGQSQTTTATKTTPITKIVLDRRMNGWGGGPAYKITLHSNGKASYIGTEGVARLGKYTGSVAQTDYNKMISLLNSLNFPHFKKSAVPPRTDAAVVMLSTYRTGKREGVFDTGLGGLAEMQRIEKAMHGIAAKIKWQKEPSGSKSKAAKG